MMNTLKNIPWAWLVPTGAIVTQLIFWGEPRVEAWVSLVLAVFVFCLSAVTGFGFLAHHWAQRPDSRFHQAARRAVVEMAERPPLPNGPVSLRYVKAYVLLVLMIIGGHYLAAFAFVLTGFSIFVLDTHVRKLATFIRIKDSLPFN